MIHLVSAIVMVWTEWYLIQPIDQVGRTILHTNFEIETVAFTTITGAMSSKADIDTFFYALSFVWQFVLLNIQPY